jgi:hypothetical protein
VAAELAFGTSRPDATWMQLPATGDETIVAERVMPRVG